MPSPLRSLRSLPALLLALLAGGCQDAVPDEKPDPLDTGAPPGPDDTDDTDDTDVSGPGAGDPDGDTGGGETGDTDTGDGTDTSGDTAPDSGTPDSGTPACTDWADPVERGTVADAALDEISDIVPSRVNRDVFWVHEDSGGDPVLYAIDATGATIGTLTVDGATNRDWEDLAVAPCPDRDGECLWIGDTGDNGLSRDDVAVLLVPEPTVDGAFAVTATPTTFRYAFPDGRGNVEGLGIGPDGLPWLVTKRVDATADVYRFPTLDASTRVTLEHVARIDTGDPADEHPYEATGADISADGTRLLVRTYGALLEYPLVDGVPGDPVTLPSPDERQGEAAGYDPVSGGVWLTSEGAHAPIWFVGCI